LSIAYWFKWQLTIGKMNELNSSFPAGKLVYCLLSIAYWFNWQLTIGKMNELNSSFPAVRQACLLPIVYCLLI